MKRKLSLLFFAALLLGAYFIWTVELPRSGEDKEVIFQISGNQAVDDIASNLEAENLIRSSLSFRLYTRLSGKDRNIKAGRFRLNTNMSAKDILEKITGLEVEELAVTFPEGFTVKEMDKRLAEMGLLKEGDFLQCTYSCDFSEFDFLPANSSLEGFLFPDTYFVSTSSFTPRGFIVRMLANFQNKFDDELTAQMKKTDYSLFEIVTMASIVEKEVRTSEDYSIVAGILWKRLDNKWPLGADATLLYNKADNEISYEDLQEDSLYNTRKVLGLPPTAIGNPGIKAIRGALYPETSPYWFYLTTKDGTVIYSKTNEEHNDNKRRYL